MDNWLEEWIEMIDFEMDEQQQPASKKRKFSLRNIMLKGTAQTRAALEFLPRR